MLCSSIGRIYNVKIYIYDGIKDYDGNDEEIIMIDISEYVVATSTNEETGEITNHLSINDMMFVDGNLYILWSCNYGECDETGIIESFGGVLCVNEDGTTVENLFGETTLKTMELGGDHDVYYYGPSTENSTTQLFGPTKFIAIKPKKLVFADEGIFVYVDNPENPENPEDPKYKNINRVVEIDLDAKAIVENPNPINTVVSFTKDNEVGIQLYSDYSSIFPAE